MPDCGRCRREHGRTADLLRNKLRRGFFVRGVRYKYLYSEIAYDPFSYFSISFGEPRAVGVACARLHRDNGGGEMILGKPLFCESAVFIGAKNIRMEIPGNNSQRCNHIGVAV